MDNKNLYLRYANAFLALAEEENFLPEAFNDLNSVKKFFSEEAKAKENMKNPLLSKNEKIDFIKKELENKVSKKTIDFLKLIIDKQRAEYLSDIIDESIEQYYLLQNTIRAEVTSSSKLSDEQEGDIIKQIKALSGAKGVLLKKNIDPEILGGIILQIKDKLWDLSLKGKLKQIENKLQEIN